MQEGPAIDIDQLSTLSRIQLTEEEKAAYAAQLSDILGFFRKLQEVDVSGTPPMAHPFEAGPTLREDMASTPWEPQRALRNAPATREDQIVVPKVVEDA